MARIAGIDLPRNKRVEVGLTYIFGIGRSTSREILSQTGVNPDTRVKDLAEAEVSRLREVINADYKVEGDLRREVSQNIKRLQEIGCYRGLRHRQNLPVRGQRTRTNARTKRGPRRTVPGRGRRRGARKK
jgi:small subunit ribosomal protein S13